MILSDRDIQQRLERDLVVYPPPWPEQIQPASLDVRLGCSFIRFREWANAKLDVRDPELFEDSSIHVTLPLEHPTTIKPGEFLLATTLETVKMPDDLVARIEGRSSLGRLGLTVHVTAGFIDPGFHGKITLEMANLNRFPITVYTGGRIAQLAFTPTSSPVETPYGSENSNSKYQGQSTVTASRIAEEKK